MNESVADLATGEDAGRIAEAILEAFKGLKTEAIIHIEDEYLTRFAGGIIHQNVGHYAESASIRVIEGKRQGRVDINRFDSDSLAEARRRALAIAVATPVNDELSELPDPQEYKPLNAYFQSTADFGPEKRAEIVARAVDGSVAAGLEASGTVSTGRSYIAVVNSNGLAAGQAGTEAAFALTTSKGDASGWAERSHPDIEQINIDQVIEIATAKGVKSYNPETAPAGRYTVVLEPAAVADILFFMHWDGFGAVPFEEGRSFMSGRLNEKITSDRITIVDDAYAPGITGGLPFDLEGIPRQNVTLIHQGVARGVVHDRLTAARAGVANTGHSLPQPNASGPIPLNLRLDPGDTPLADMARGIKRGLWVSRFHYTNSIDPKRLVLTGMTRDGTFFIENGEVTRPVTNLRFTEAMIEALNRVEAVGDLTLSQGATFGGAFSVPALRIADFNFSSETTF
jgi:predicted Zn-dependent protease